MVGAPKAYGLRSRRPPRGVRKMSFSTDRRSMSMRWRRRLQTCPHRLAGIGIFAGCHRRIDKGAGFRRFISSGRELEKSCNARGETRARTRKSSSSAFASSIRPSREPTHSPYAVISSGKKFILQVAFSWRQPYFTRLQHVVPRLIPKNLLHCRAAFRVILIFRSPILRGRVPIALWVCSILHHDSFSP